MPFSAEIGKALERCGHDLKSIIVTGKAGNNNFIAERIPNFHSGLNNEFYPYILINSEIKIASTLEY
ncbi:hypothetical protein CPBBRM18_IMEEAPEM_00137 [Companilactobacillus paralimentarius]